MMGILTQNMGLTVFVWNLWDNLFVEAPVRPFWHLLPGEAPRFHRFSEFSGNSAVSSRPNEEPAKNQSAA